MNRNIYNMTDEERLEGAVPALPNDLYSALKELEADSLIREALGEHLFEKYYEAKLIEWDEYRVQVTRWEIEKYLNKF